jgi:hypothetical protein
MAPNIQARTNGRITACRSQLTARIVVAVAIATLCLLSTSGWAIIQIMGSVRLDSAKGAGLITTLEVTPAGSMDSNASATPQVGRHPIAQQTDNQITVTLDWAYADVHRVVFGYRVENLTVPEESGSSLPRFQYAVSYPDGRPFGTGGLSSATQLGSTPNSFAGYVSFDHDEPLPENSPVQLVLEMLISGRHSQSDRNCDLLPPGAIASTPVDTSGCLAS